MSNEIPLASLDASSLRDYLAALGVLASITDTGHAARIRWTKTGSEWRMPCAPVLDVDLTADEVVDVLAGELADASASPDPYFGIDENLDVTADEVRAVAEECSIDPADASSRRSLGWLSATVGHHDGEVRRFSLHLLAGQLRFLRIAKALMYGRGKEPAVGPDDIRDALWGQQARRGLSSFRWEPARNGYARRAEDPSTDPAGCVPGAEWLAFRGLPLLSLAGYRVHGHTDGSMTYPLWSSWMDSFAVASLLRHPWVHRPHTLVSVSEDDDNGGVLYSDRMPGGELLPPGTLVLSARIGRSPHGLGHVERAGVVYSS